MSLTLYVFGVADILAGAMLWHTAWFPVQWLHIIGWAVLLKGVYSISVSVWSKFYFDVMGWIDLLTAAILLAGWSIPFFWALPIAKGGWSLIAAYAESA
ncbi:MAG: hypothetical protein HY366_00835 [Candidatus Aenigmarchaeota archaeon]|nr:hypothetical protein [Candidatus Aenigmarchaeota archaeon]